MVGSSHSIKRLLSINSSLIVKFDYVKTNIIFHTIDIL